MSDQGEKAGNDTKALMEVVVMEVVAMAADIATSAVVQTDGSEKPVIVSTEDELVEGDIVSSLAMEDVDTEKECVASPPTQQQVHVETSDRSSDVVENSAEVDARDEQIPHENEHSSEFHGLKNMDGELNSMSDTNKVPDEIDCPVLEEIIADEGTTKTTSDNTEMETDNDPSSGTVLEQTVVTNDTTTTQSPNITETTSQHTKTLASESSSRAIVRGTAGSLVAGYRSDGSESDDTSSDSDSTTSTSSCCEIVRVVERPDSEEEKAKTFKPKTRGELLVEDLPPIEDLCITVDAGTPLVPLGKVSSIVGHLVVVQSEPNTAPLDMDSIIFTEDRKSLGQVFETFGPVKCPLYSMRFNTVDQITEKGVEVGMRLFCAPSVPDYTHFVFMTDLQNMKGSDASWENNNEPPAKFLDFSDDEQERMAKNKKNRKRGNDGNGSLQQWPPEDDRDSPDGSAQTRRQNEKRAPRGRRGPRATPPAQQEMSDNQYRPRPHARFGAPPMFPVRPMGAPPHMYGMSNMAPPRFVPPPMYQGERPTGPPPGPGYSWQPTPAPVHWPQWPSAPHHQGGWPSAPGAPRQAGWPPASSSRPPPPGSATYYSSQADYWSQYGK